MTTFRRLLICWFLILLPLHLGLIHLSAAPPANTSAIASGTFIMGDTLDSLAGAATNSVTLSAFYIDTNLVSWGQWLSVYQWATNHGYGFNHSGAGKGTNHPVQTVDWYDAVKWCNARSLQEGRNPAYFTDTNLTRVYTNGEVSVYVNWSARGYRLPTEAEWERSARGGLVGQRFSYGNTISSTQANYKGAGGLYAYDLATNGFGIFNAAGSVGGTSPATSPVGSFPPNGFGLYDMAGNLWEWCWDWYAASYAGGTDPHGSAAGNQRVIRGGAWSVDASNCRVGLRNIAGPTSSSISYGFRCVLPQTAAPDISGPGPGSTNIAGSVVLLSAAVTGANPLYLQWRRNGNPIAGATNTLLTLSNLLVADSGSYDLLATNLLGSATSSATVLSVIRATPVVTLPVAGTLVYGQTLGTSTLTGGGATNQANGSLVPGSFTFALPGAVPKAGTTNASLIFTPSDTANFNGATNTVLVTVNKAPAAVALSQLAQIYSGTSKTAVATTQPNNLSVTLTYNGAGTPPVNAGSYTVIASVLDSNYSGGATNVLVISPASANVYLGDLNQTYNGSPCAVNATTSPLGIPLRLTYNALPAVPVNAGVYTVTATIIDPNYVGSAAGTLLVSPRPATVLLGNLDQHTDGTPKPATAATIPPGLAVALTYNGSPVAPSTPGTYTVVGTLTNPNYSGGATDLMVLTSIVIVQEPQDRMALAGHPALFSVSASSPDPLRYQWYFSNHSLQSGAAARAGLYAGFVINGIVTNGGEGYTSVPAVQFTGGGGTNAGGAARLSNGRVASIQITNAGLGYLTPPQILIDPPNGLLIGQTNPVLNLNAVGSALVGGYYVVISSAVDSVTSRVATLGLALSPQIVRQPQNQLVPFGAAVTLDVAATGTPALQYEWRRIAANRSTATATVFVTNGFVVVTHLTGRGTGYLSEPAVQFVGGGGRGATARAIVSNGQVTSIQLTSAGSGYFYPPRVQIEAPGSRLVSIQSDSALVIPGAATNDSGNYFVVVSSPFGSTTSRTVSLAVGESVVPRLSITAPLANQFFSNATFSINGKASDNLAVAKVRCQINAADGQDGITTNHWSNWSAVGTLHPGTNEVRAWAEDTCGNLSLTSLVRCVYIPSDYLQVRISGAGSVTPGGTNALLELGKTYTLLATPAYGSVFSNWLGGVSGPSVELGVQPRLTFTMDSNLVLQANFVTNPFPAVAGNYQGLFYDTNNPGHDNAGFFNATVTASGGFTAKLQHGADQPSISGQFSVGGLWGTNHLALLGTNPVSVHWQLDLSGGGISGSLSNSLATAQLQANRAVFDSAHPTSCAGKYTLIISGNADTGHPPAGNGYGSLTVSPNGILAFTGKTGDGAPAAQGTILSKQGMWPFYVSLYSGKGSLFGWLSFTNDTDRDIEGVVNWTKPAQPGAVSYPAGLALTGAKGLETLGSRFNGTNGFRVLTLTNGVLVLDNGNLLSGLTNGFMLGNNNVATGSNGLSITFDSGTGLFSGGLTTAQNLGLIRVGGAVLQKQNAGYGQFPGTNQIGSVFLGTP